MKKIIGIFILSLFMLVQFGYSKATKNKNSFAKPSLIGQIARMQVNNIDLGIENNGNYGLDGDTYFPAGSGKSFLFAGGLGLSGYDNSGALKVSWMMAASRIYEFQAGPWGTDPDDPKAKFYRVTSDDTPGSDAYVAWADAVALGADFVDMNNDGVYDPNVDKPDLLGDETIWCVYNDGVPQANRGLVNGQPLGVTVYQTLFGFKRSDDLGNVLFMRYRIRNDSGGDLHDVIFSAIDDPDLGDYQDDLIGCDTTLSLGFIYNSGSDADYGDNVPAYGIDFFQGPIVDSPGDTAYKFLGPEKGIEVYPDKKNLGMTSFMFYIQSDPTIGDPDLPEEARFYMEGGKGRNGDPIDPVTFPYGRGGTPTTNPKFLYSGDPVTDTGWLDNTPSDKRFMVNCGPFELKANDIQDVVIGLVVGQGNDYLESVTRLKEIDQKAQVVYNTNFDLAGPPPVPTYTVATVNNKIRISINLGEVINYEDSDASGTRQVFEGLAIYQYKSNTAADVVNGQINSKLVAAYDVDDAYTDIYLADKSSRTLVWKGVNNLTRNDKGLIVELDGDAFNSNNPFIPGKTYYFAIVPFSVDVNNITQLTTTDWEVGPAGILFAGKKVFSVTVGADELQYYDAAQLGDQSGVVEHVAGTSDGVVDVTVVDPSAVTGHDYNVEFFIDQATRGYLWRIVDANTGTTVVDSITNLPSVDEMDNFTFPIVDGMMIRAFTLPLALDTVVQSEGTESDVYFDWQVLGPIWDYTTWYAWAVGDADFKNTRLVFDTQKNYVAHTMYFDPNWGYRYLDTVKTYVAAYDISDPDNPRQVNVIIRDVGATEDLDMDGSFERCFITSTDYSPDPSIYPLDPNWPPVGDAILTFWPTLKDPATPIMSAKVAFDFLFTNGITEKDQYVVHTGLLKTGLTDQEKRDLVKKINVVPNPYWAYSEYELSYDSPVLKFTHIPGKATIRIFNLAGQLVKTIETDGSSPFVSWNLKNEAGLKVASGMYIAHVNVEGLGEKVLKFAIVQREERIDQY